MRLNEEGAHDDDDRIGSKKCSACEGKEKAFNEKEITQYLKKVPSCERGKGGQEIRKQWELKDFMAAIHFFDEVAKIAQEEDHHPDLHLTGYRHVVIELSTHAVKGLTENDFILAAKIDQLPVTLKKTTPK